MEHGDKPKVVLVCGTTGAGKSKVAIELALALGGEVVNADAMQMYDGLNVATAKARLGSLLLPARLC
jgi:tRNA dimethylallyltransferase